jgi:hypothetical protein
MTGRRMIAFVLAFLLIAAPWSSATAEPVLYTIKFVASGTVDGVPFTDESLTFAGVTDTDTAVALVEVDPQTLLQIIHALSLAAGVFLAVVAVFVVFKEAKTHGQRQTKLLAAVTLAGPLIVPVVRDGALVNLTIDSIRDNTIELQTRHVAGGL